MDNGLYTIVTTNFGRGTNSGMVRRTFTIIFVVVFSGLIVNPFISFVGGSTYERDWHVRRAIYRVDMRHNDGERPHKST